jgi:hypothetical protein
MTNVTVASELNDKVLRRDWLRMRDDSFEHAIRLAAFVGRALKNEPAAEVDAGRNQKQYYLSFVALRKALPRTVLCNLVTVGPKLMDFMNVITEVSGLSVIQVNEGLWFFDMRGRNAHHGGYPAREFAQHYASITQESPIPQFWPNDEEADEDGL